MTIRMLTRVLVLTAALSGPATAAVYVGNWDPPFTDGLPFSNWGWRGDLGDVSFFVPDTCVVDDGPVNNDPDCGALAAVTTATVTLYDTGDNSLIGILPFDAGSMTISVLHYAGGLLTSLETDLSAGAVTDFAVGVSPDLSTYGFDQTTEFKLQFTATGPRLGLTCGLTLESCANRNNDNPGFRPTFTITRVPEPASLALAGLALTGIAALRRRRQAH